METLMRLVLYNEPGLRFSTKEINSERNMAQLIEKNKEKSYWKTFQWKCVTE